jgi:hypothetical protein
MAGGKFKYSFTGNPPQSRGPPHEGLFHQPHQGGPSKSNPQGGILNPNPYGLHSGQSFLGVLNPTWGPKGQPYFPPQGKIPYPPQGQPSYPPQGKTGYPPQNIQENYPPLGYTDYPPQGQMGFPSPFMKITQQINPTFVGQHQQNMGGPVGYNYPPQLVYHPTGVPMPH